MPPGQTGSPVRLGVNRGRVSAGSPVQERGPGFSDEEKASITAVSIDMSAGYEKAIRSPDGLPNAKVCFDPFHVCQLGGRAADQVRRDEYNRHGRSSSSEGRWIKGTRYSLLKDTANQTPKQLAKLAEVVLTNRRMYRASCCSESCATSTDCPNTKPPNGSTRGWHGRPDQNSRRS